MIEEFLRYLVHRARILLWYTRRSTNTTICHSETKSNKFYGHGTVDPSYREQSSINRYFQAGFATTSDRFDRFFLRACLVVSFAFGIFNKGWDFLRFCKAWKSMQSIVSMVGIYSVRKISKHLWHCISLNSDENTGDHEPHALSPPKVRKCQQPANTRHPTHDMQVLSFYPKGRLRGRANVHLVLLNFQDIYDGSVCCLSNTIGCARTKVS